MARYRERRLLILSCWQQLRQLGDVRCNPARLRRMYAGDGPARKKSREVAYSRRGCFDAKAACVKAPSPSAWGLIPSIRSGSKYINLSSALR